MGVSCSSGDLTTLDACSCSGGRGRVSPGCWRWPGAPSLTPPPLQVGLLWSIWWLRHLRGNLLAGAHLAAEWKGKKGARSSWGFGEFEHFTPTCQTTPSWSGTPSPWNCLLSDFWRGGEEGTTRQVLRAGPGMQNPPPHHLCLLGPLSPALLCL